MEMETQDQIEDRAEDNQMMDDGGVREEGCCYSAGALMCFVGKSFLSHIVKTN